MNIDFDKQHEIAVKIKRATLKRHKLVDMLALVDRELERRAKQTSVYGLLDQVSGQLKQLHEMGAGKLFWGDKYTSENANLEHVEELHKTARAFNEKIEIIQNKKIRLEEEIKVYDKQLLVLNGDLAEQKELEEESKHDFVITRAYEPLPYRPMLMPWYKKGEDENRFRKYLFLSLSFSILLGVLVPRWQLPIPDVNEEVEVPERIAKFIRKIEPKPEPVKEPELKVEDDTKPAEKEPEELKPEEVKPVELKPVEVEAKTVPDDKPKSVSNVGVLAFKNNFSDLIDDAPDAKLGANAELSTQGSSAKQRTRSIVSTAGSGSGGINTAGLSRDGGVGRGSGSGVGDGIGAAEFSRVSSDIGTAAGNARPLSDGPGPGRTDEEIQIVFDRYKSALYRIYNRELRKNPTLQGQMVMRLTIQPDGSVSMCQVESTDMDSAALVADIIARVKRFNFGPKANVPAITILYPIDFLPAS